METQKNRNRKKLQKNSIKTTALAVASIILFSIGILTITKQQDNSTNAVLEIIHQESKKRLFTEIANTNEKRARGFMFRTNLNQNDAMLFIFDEPTIQTFWMLNTPTSLDIIFLDQNYRVINYFQNTIPNQTHTRYSSKAPSQYVLETKTGFVEQSGLKVGDVFIVPTE